DRKRVQALYRGMNQLAKSYRVAIIGGNLTCAPRVFVDITVLGQVEKKRVVLRSGGSPGDRLFVTGTLGGSRFGHHFSFEPRIGLARRLTSLVPVKAMMDLSDGLGADLPRLAEASRTGFRLFADRLPISPHLLSSKTSSQGALWHALNDGEDYELLFAVPEKYCHRVPRSVTGVPVTFIGELTDGEKVLIASGKRMAFPTGGFDHFRRVL
ncbi:MAG TPA: thiamine-phosphate kinase, partial [bacterium]|nr:thiamine-phosphate kinase [bacterium]